MIAVISGCHPSIYQQFYKQLIDATASKDVELLAPGQEPKIYCSDNLDRDARILRPKLYVPTGYASFNGRYEDESRVVAQAAYLMDLYW